MRRVAVESVVVGAATAVVVVAWFGFPALDTVCGPDGATFAWRLTHLRAVWAGEASLGLDAGGTVPLAGWPMSLLAALLAAVVGATAAWQVALALAVGAGAGAIWGFSRGGGAGVPAAALATAVGALPVVVARGLGSGGADLAVVPFAAVALGLASRREPRARVLAAAAIVLCGACDARTGAVLGVATAAAGGGGWALLAGVVAGGMGVAAGAAAGVLDPVDVAAPFLSLRAEALAPGLAALAGVLWFVGDRGLRRAAAVAFVCALGPVLSAFGDPLTIGGAGVPLPGAIAAAFAPAGAGWAGALVVAAVAVALGLGRLVNPRLALVLAPLALFEARAVAGSPPECLTLDAPVAVRALGEREGGVLNLPVIVSVGGEIVGGPSAAHALYLYQRTFHGRPLATDSAPLGSSDPLFGEPAVVLSLGATVGTERWLMPPTKPGEVLRGLGITEIVVHRTLFAPAALALMDPVLFRLYGAPQRDHAGNVDLYRIATEGSARPPVAETLHPADAPAPNGWMGLAAYLAGRTPILPGGGADAGAAAGGEGPAGPPPPEGAASPDGGAAVPGVGPAGSADAPTPGARADGQRGPKKDRAPGETPRRPRGERRSP